MQQNYGDKLRTADQLRLENDIMRMKLMLENGAEFKIPPKHEIDPFVENDFLTYITVFEKQAENAKPVRIFDKLKRPTQFRPVAEIPDAQIRQAWQELDTYMHSYKISLDVCSPNITPRELYRFATEELFNYEMTDLDIPGMMTGFIYDEFYPDPVYDNTRTAIEECMRFIIQKKPIEWMYNFFDSDLTLNGYSGLSAAEFRELVNRFKGRYIDITLSGIICSSCIVKETECIVSGTYAALLTTITTNEMVANEWQVKLLPDQTHGYWSVSAAQIKGMTF